MKKADFLRFVLFSGLIFFLAATTEARVIFLSPSGNDNTGNGSISSPWFTLNKAWTVLAAGDTVYLRGGTYQYNRMQNLLSKNGTAFNNRICIFNYPGEHPIITRGPSYKVVNGIDQDLIYFEGNYFHWKGIEISGFEQLPGETSYPAFRAGYTTGSKFEQIIYHDNMAGFQIRGNGSTMDTIINCDFYRNIDSLDSPPYGGADGLNITFNNVTTSVNWVIGCRAWNNSDDGFDNWANDGTVYYENCWSFHNGYRRDYTTLAGDGSGFKMGIGYSPTTSLRRKLTFCIAADNSHGGFVENNNLVRFDFINCTSYNNAENFYMGYWSPSNGIHNYTNCISANHSNDIMTSSNNTFVTNSWNGFTVTNADFQSTGSWTELSVARKSDGSLPDVNYLKLAPGSDMIGKGTNVMGTSDLGALPYSAPSNIPPAANAGTDKTITLPTSSVTLNGSGSDPDGTITAYAWTKISGPTSFTIASPASATTNITGLVQGTYTFRLTVTDNGGLTASDDVVITVNPAPNQAPTANAGTDKTITLPTSSVTMNGSGSDSDGTITTYAWTKISGPTSFTIASPASATTNITGLVQGAYTFRLTVTDNGGLTASPGTDRQCRN